MNIGEFFLKLGVKVDDTKLEKFNKQVKAGVGELKSLAVGTTVAVAGLLKLTDTTVKATVDLENLNKQTGLSIAQLQKWQKASQLTDVSLSAEQVAQNIKSLQENIFELQRFGTGNAQGFNLLGIDIKGKDAFQVLDQMREAIKGLSNAEATNLIQKTGLSSNFINVLRTSRSEFDKLGQGWFLDEDQRDTIIKIGTAMTKLKLSMIELKDQAIVALAPVTNTIVTAFQNFINASIQVTKWVTSSEVAFKSLLIILAGIGAFLFPITAKFIALYLVIEDFITFLAGGESVIGDFFMSLYDWFLKAEKGLDNFIKKLDVLKSVKGFLKPIGEFFSSIGDDMALAFNGTQATSLATSGASLGSSNTTNNKNANVTNNYNINSTANPQDLAGEITSQQTKGLNNTYNQLLGGAK